MKRVLVFLLTLLFTAGTGTVMAQQDKAADKAAKKEAKAAEKAAKKAEKEAKKQQEEAIANLAFQQAVKALEAKDFVLEAERVQFKRGVNTTVNSTTNFVSVKGDRATIQLSGNGAIAGPNGVGGITVEGKTSNVEMRTDKKGNITYEMSVQGTAVSAKVTFRMLKGSNECDVTVNPNFNSNRITFEGPLVPSAHSRVYKGRSI